VTFLTTPDTCGKEAGTATVNAQGNNGPYTYSWSNGNNSNTITNIGSGNYTVIITDDNGCTTINQTNVTEIPPPTLTTTLSPQIISQGGSITLFASGATSYSWSPASGLSCSNCATPTATPDITTTYTVTGTDANGCTSTANITISIDYDCNELFIPTIFSPNGNGPEKNETVCIYSNCIAEMEFAIYSRWGQQIFSTNNPQQCWDGTFDGKELTTGAYTYRLFVKQLDGNIVRKSGTITLVK
jgi:gliding motility-associated-like protein